MTLPFPSSECSYFPMSSAVDKSYHRYSPWRPRPSLSRHLSPRYALSPHGSTPPRHRGFPRRPSGHPNRGPRPIQIRDPWQAKNRRARQLVGKKKERGASQSQGGARQRGKTRRRGDKRAGVNAGVRRWPGKTPKAPLGPRLRCGLSPDRCLRPAPGQPMPLAVRIQKVLADL